MKLSNFSTKNIDEITQLFIKTFTDSEGESEGKLVGKLVHDIMTNTAPSDLYGYTATEDGQIIGSVLFTRIKFQRDICAFILSPVAIDTDFQGNGVGQSLIRYGISYLEKNNVSIIVTYGDPAFYSKFGFKQISEKTIKPPFRLSFPEGWLALSVSGEQITPIPGTLSCVPAFNNPELW